MRPTEMGLGLAALGRPGYINLGHAIDLQADYAETSMQQHAHAVLDAAWRCGIRYFDAARSYGRAEAFLATWLESRKVASDLVTVASKWGYTYTADWNVNVPEGLRHEVKQHSLGRLETQLAESRKLLDCQLNLYQIHSATIESGVLDNVEVLERLASLRDQGLEVGLSVSGPAQDVVIRKALDCRVGGRQVFSTVQATWNLLEPSAAAALQEASDSNWRVIVKEGLANGRLTTRNDHPDFVQKLGFLRKLAVEFDSTVDAVALAIVVAQPWSDVVLSGAACCDHVQTNFDALELAEMITPVVETEEFAVLAEKPETYWQIRSNLAWN